MASHAARVLKAIFAVRDQKATHVVRAGLADCADYAEIVVRDRKAMQEGPVVPVRKANPAALAVPVRKVNPVALVVPVRKAKPADLVRHGPKPAIARDSAHPASRSHQYCGCHTIPGLWMMRFPPIRA